MGVETRWTRWGENTADGGAGRSLVEQRRQTKKEEGKASCLFFFSPSDCRLSRQRCCSLFRGVSSSSLFCLLQQLAVFHPPHVVVVPK